MHHIYTYMYSLHKESKSLCQLILNIWKYANKTSVDCCAGLSGFSLTGLAVPFAYASTELQVTAHLGCWNQLCYRIPTVTVTVLYDLTDIPS